ncbi:MAG: nucleotidyltransferase domain-containing protein [Candidatus Aminicenantes bacterium]|nr:nucleotidyltransferase domain-containing protein [Candidatus Aminicenantes bacterium]
MNEESIKRSVSELKSLLSSRFGDEVELYLFGSVVREDYHPESDIDILVLFPGRVDTALKEEIIDLAYSIELRNDVVFGIVVRSKAFWASAQAAAMPFHQNLQREAMLI